MLHPACLLPRVDPSPRCGPNCPPRIISLFGSGLTAGIRQDGGAGEPVGALRVTGTARDCAEPTRDMVIIHICRNRRPPPTSPSAASQRRLHRSTCAHVIAASEAANNDNGMAGELAAQMHYILTHKLRPCAPAAAGPALPPGAQVPFPVLNLSPAGTGARHLKKDDACAGTGRKSNPRRGGPERVHPRLLCA